jgi:hypothetical protein
MGDKYSLKITNKSDNPDFTFGVYTVAPIDEAAGTYPIAWQTKALDKGNSITFSWTLDFALMFSAQGAAHGASWVEEGTPAAVSDDSASTNSAQLGYDQDYTLALVDGAHPVAPGRVFLDTTSTVPRWSSDKGPSVALAIATADGTPVPAIAGNSGPNLHHMFDLHPTYYLRAGQIEQGVMADLDTVTDGQKVVFVKGARYAAYIFNEDNQWVPDTSPH